jgi:lysophospholipase L1-like esterase
MVRRTPLAAFISLALLLGLLPAGAAADTPLPGSMAAVGDSITQAASTGGSLGADYPQNSWSTGTNASVNSHYQRLVALNPAITGRATNLSVSGAKMVHLNGQMQQAAALQPDYVTVLIGGNDICTDTEAQMTSVPDFRAQFEAAMATISASPGTTVYVVSIPRVLGLWELFRNDWWARFIWSIGGICQSLLANPTSTQSADVQRRARVAQRNVDYNQVLFEVCDAAPSCHWDGWAAYNTVFTANDVSADYFHPSIAGQAKLAGTSWAAGPWTAPPNQAPTAAFSFSCADLSCTFDGSGSADADGTIASYAWQFGGGGSASGVTASHAFASAGTYPVTLTVTDDDGATHATSQNVTVSAPPPPPPQDGTLSVGSLDGDAASRKGGWTATVTITVVDGEDTLVSGATVSGTWSAGGSTTCTTGADGTCSASTPMNKKATSVTWTISTITHATLTYEPNASTFVVIGRP